MRESTSRPFRRRTALRGLGALGVLSLAGCADLEKGKAVQARELLAAPKVNTADGLRIGGELIADRELLTAARKDRVILYSGTGQEAEELTVARFEEQTGIKVELTRLATNKLAERVLSEHGAGRLSAGVIRITDVRIATEFARAGVYVPYRTPVHETLERQNAVPDDRFWTGYYFINSFGYNSALITENQPTRWEDLTDARYNGKLGVVAVTTGGTTVALAHFQIDNFGTDYLRALGRQEARIFDSTSTQIDALARGEIAIGTLSFNNAFAAQAAGAPIELVVPEKGVSACEGPMGLTAKGVKSPAAQVFANWSMSKEGQRFAGSQGFVAARTDIGRVRSGRYELPTADSPRFHLFTEAGMKRHADADEKAWKSAFRFIG